MGFQIVANGHIDMFLILGYYFNLTLIKIPMDAYTVDLKDWEKTPIVREINPLTGKKEGEDCANLLIGNPGFRGMPTCEENDEDLLVPDVNSRSVFDGFSEHDGKYDPKLVLPGGLDKGVMVVRESTARGLDLTAELIGEATADAVQLILVDGFESWKRQSSGFTRTFKELLAADGIEGEPTVEQLHSLGIKANGTYCYVNVAKDDLNYLILDKELRANSVFMQEVTAYAQSQLQPGEKLEEKVDQILHEYITISANSQLGPAKDRNVHLNYENNAHAGGAAVDVMLADKDGKLLDITPYLWVGEEAGMDYMEDDANYDNFIRATKEKPKLAEHLAKIGFPTPEQFTRSNWEELKIVRRIRYHAFKAVGATFYSAHDGKDGGEFWHHEFGNIIFTPDGKVVYAAPTARKYPHSGNPGHTLQVVGPSGTAVYGGGSAHKIARKQYGLQA